MAPVAQGVEVSLIVQRMEGSELPTHQPYSSPRTHARTFISTHMYRNTCIVAATMGFLVPIIRWDKNRNDKIKCSKDFDSINCLQSGKGDKLWCLLAHTDTRAHLTLSILLSPTHWHTLTRLYMPKEYSQMDYYESRNYVTKDYFKWKTLDSKARWDFALYESTFSHHNHAWEKLPQIKWLFNYWVNAIRLYLSQHRSKIFSLGDSRSHDQEPCSPFLKMKPHGCLTIGGHMPGETTFESGLQKGVISVTGGGDWSEFKGEFLNLFPGKFYSLLWLTGKERGSNTR